MTNNEILKLKGIITGLQNTNIDNIKFAFELVDLDLDLDLEIKKINTVIQSQIKFDEKEMILNEKIEAINKYSQNKKEDFEKLESEFEKDTIKSFNEKQLKLNEILNLESEYQIKKKIKRNNLPIGLTLNDYKLLAQISE